MPGPSISYEEIKEILSDHPDGISVPEIVAMRAEMCGYCERVRWKQLIYQRLTMLNKYGMVSKSYRAGSMCIFWRLVA